MSAYVARARHAAVLVCLLSLDCRFTDLTKPGPGQTGTHPAGTLSSSSTLTLGGRPHGIAIANTGRFCVSQIDAASVTCGMLSATDATLLGPVAVGVQPAHVALSVDGTEAYTANQGGNSMSIVSVTGSVATATIPLPSDGYNVLADPRNSAVYVTTLGGQLEVVDGATRSVVAQVSVGAASNGLALDRTTGILYVSSITAGNVVAVNTTSNTVVRTYMVGGKPQRIALSANGKRLYVATEFNGLEMVDLATGQRVVVTGVEPGAVGLALAPDEKVLYVTNPQAGELQIVNLATLEVTTMSGLLSPRNVAFGLSGAAAMVTGEGDRVYVIR
jgi:DNA-binding beta-propeller fold protein YncE